MSVKESAFAAAAIGSFYCIAGLSAILYPGTDWTDPDWPNAHPQRFLFPSMIALVWAGYWLEVRRIGSGKGKVQ